MIKFILLLLTLFSGSMAVTAQNVILPAEFERNEGLILKWNYNAPIDAAILKIAEVITAENKIWLIYDPDNPTTMSEIQSQLTANGSNISNIEFIEGSAENPWIRDYGPIAGYYTTATDYTRHFIDAQYLPATYPDADFLPVQLASDFGFNYAPLSLNFEGGNLLLDGIGRGFVSERVLTQNPGMNANQIIQALYTQLHLNEVIILPSVPECGGGEWSELSRLVKFVDSETVLVAEFPPSYTHYQQVEMIADTLANTYNDVGKIIQVVRLPVSPDASGNFALTSEGSIRSYTSSIIFNNLILIPSYNNPTNDAIALSTYEQVFPGYQVFQIPSESLAATHGSLYRMAVAVPQPKLFRIRHSKNTGMQDFQPEIWLNTFVLSFEPADSIQIFYRIHPSPVFEVLNTYGCCGGNSGSITGYTISDTISYYVQAYGGDHTQTQPLAAPDGLYTFWFDPYTSTGPEQLTEQFSIYPNPARDYIFIKGIAKTEKNVVYRLINLHGSVLAEGRVPDDASIRIPDQLINGFYLLKINTSGKTHISKLYLHR